MRVVVHYAKHGSDGNETESFEGTIRRTPWRHETTLEIWGMCIDWDIRRYRPDCITSDDSWQWLQPDTNSSLQRKCEGFAVVGASNQLAAEKDRKKARSVQPAR